MTTRDPSPLRCPMPECRRALESEFWSTTGTRTSEPCIHFVAIWPEGGESEAAMVEAIIYGLDGDREFVIRNVRASDEEVRRRLRAADLGMLAGIVQQRLHVVIEDGGRRGAAFGDRHERSAASRELAQVIAGPDPILGGGSMRPA
ncbi:MAG: hypothetical protein F4056_08760 [Chloroflexi bacterium]|nr:hypothetical protein [Chloroflexota bacterium]